MKRFWKNVLNAVIIILISGGVATVVTAYVMKNNNGENVFSDKYETTFKQPFQTTMYNSVAAENTDLRMPPRKRSMRWFISG